MLQDLQSSHTYSVLQFYNKIFIYKYMITKIITYKIKAILNMWKPK
jgi:hypothetical protein